MAIPILSSALTEFPDIEQVYGDGIVAIGGNLTSELLLSAYNKGAFPWFDEEDPITWWCPIDRMVLLTDELKVSKSMRKVLRDNIFQFTVNQCFEEVVRACGAIPRPNQDGTWITNDIINAYTKLHTMGYAHSVEVWQNNELVGGVYGLLNHKVFFGESMFSKVSNASKAGFIVFTEFLREAGVVLIDCQVYTDHLASFGAQEIPIGNFLQVLPKLIQNPTLRDYRFGRKFQSYWNEKSSH